jgi:hypothetical protein
MTLFYDFKYFWNIEEYYDGSSSSLWINLGKERTNSGILMTQISELRIYRCVMRESLVSYAHRAETGEI